MNVSKAIEELIEKGDLWTPIGKTWLPHISRPNLTEQKQSLELDCPRFDLPTLTFGFPSIDRTLAHGGLPRGTTHEFYSESINPPLSLLSILAVRAASALNATAAHAGPCYILWIGKNCWPNPLFLRSLVPHEKADSFFSHSLFIDPPDKKNALWSIEAALRCPAVICVIAYLRNVAFSLTRRLSLAAKKTSSLGLFVIGKEALTTPSAAATRWRIASIPSPSSHPRFELSLLKQKGGLTLFAPWILELVEDGERVSLGIPPDVVYTSRPEEIEATREEPDRLFAAQR